MNISTPYGILSDVQETSLHKNGSLASAFTHAPTSLQTKMGQLDVAHDFSSEHRKYIPSVKFDVAGSLQAVNLQKQTLIQTPCGPFAAEYLTFYPNGRLQRVFHLNGKISGYWSEEQETGLAEQTTLHTPLGPLTAKIMSLHFFSDGALASLTFFPGTLVSVPTPLGQLNSRIGLSFYPHGQLKSLEPASPLLIQTPAGKVHAFDKEPLGLSGDSNSLCWSAAGALNGCKTIDSLNITMRDGTRLLIEPHQKISLCDDDIQVKIPYTITWDEAYIYFDAAAEQVSKISLEMLVTL